MQNMQNMFEAIWLHGKTIPQESINIRENPRLLVTVVDENDDGKQEPAWQSLKGKYRGRLKKHDENILFSDLIHILDNAGLRFMPNHA